MKQAVMEGFRLAFLGRMRMQGYKVAGDLFFNRNQIMKQEQKKVVQLFKDMREVYRLFDRAEPFSAVNEDGFRLIAEMGKAVLAAKMKQNQELSFVMWEYDYDDTGFMGDIILNRIFMLQKKTLLFVLVWWMKSSFLVKKN